MEQHKTKTSSTLCECLATKHQKQNALHSAGYIGEQDFVVKVARTLEEAVKLLEGGFQLVCDYDRDKIFRKPK